MLRSSKEIIGYRLLAVDTKIGSIHDLVFDDRSWTLRYIVVDTGNWLSGRRVLLSPVAFGEPNWNDRSIPVSLTKEQIENSPGIDADKTVSRKYETELHRYYGWPAYWAAPPPGEIGYIPIAESAAPSNGHEAAELDVEKETNLRGIKEVTGYYIHATDGDIGHVDDFIVQDDVWMVRYIVVDTGNWLSGRKVLVAPLWISSIRWDERTVHVDLTTEALKNGPEFDPSQPVNREYEVRLYDFYGRPKYW